jgi:hypothetical protein
VNAQILFHGNCLDGLVSTSIFRRFLLERLDPGADIALRPMHHGPSDPYGADHDATFSADLNVVLDFRYSPSPRLHWYCDHHATSFLRPEDARHLEADRSGRKRLDPSAPSCAGLLVAWLGEVHGFSVPLFEEHARWADLVDAARFESAAQAVALEEPALRLMALLEAGPGADLVAHLVEAISTRRLEEVVGDAAVARSLGPVLELHRRMVELFRGALVVESGVLEADLVEHGVEGYNKFIPYFLEPEASHAVVVLSSARRTKVSVGRNPFMAERSRPRGEVHIGRLCASYGGGGHAAVGAVSLGPGEAERARAIAGEIVAILRRAEG